MKSEYLQEMTCSEQLTLEDEYKQQQNWLFDDDSKKFLK
jgi:hypothetical protein